MALLGVYVGNSTRDLSQFENWLGREVDGVHGVVGASNWTDFTDSARWAVDNLWASSGREVFWSVPLIVGGANLYSAANGDYNQYYRQVAEKLLQYGDGDGPIYVRTGWEFNGDWFSWSSNGKEGEFVEAFREFVDTFRSVSDRFKFEWTPNEAYGGTDPAKAYPGDNYVDIVGMDFYWKPEYTSSDAAKAWDQLLNETYGLKWHQEFAAAHGKPTAYSEWGVKTDNAETFLKLAKEWFDSHDVVYQSYWDSNAAFPGRLSDGSKPNSGAAYKDLFGSGSSDDYTWTDDNASSGGDTSDDDSAPDGQDDGADVDAGAPADEAPSAEQGNSAPQQGGNTLALSGAAVHQSWGTGATETWYGTGGNDQHQSNGGGDTLYGGAGDDSYVVSASNDRPVEQAGEGVDTVTSWIETYTLPDNVENLIFFGYGWSNGTGNGQSNIITGTSSKNTLDGKGGDDQLTGKEGPDTFVIGKGEGHDTITDFAASDGDKLLLKGFGGSAELSQDGSVWTVTAADGSTTSFTLQNLGSLSSSDYRFA